MSTPRSLQLHPCVARVTIESPFGPVAALRATPDGTSRGTVLLLPGFTGSKEDFLAVLEPLARAGWVAVAVDQRGQHETVGPDDDPRAYALDGFAHEAVATGRVLVGPDGALHLVGHSFGGLVAQAATLHDPALVRSLTLLCSGPGALPESEHDELALFENALPLLGHATVWDALRERGAVSLDDVPPEIADFVADRFLANSTGSLVGIARILSSAPDRGDDLAATGVAVQVVHGENDDAWPQDQQAELAHRLGAPLHVIAQAGHSPNVDQPEALAAVLDAFFGATTPDA